MTDNNSKLRAVLLAALMVLWVFAGTMAFAGGAAAQTAVTDVDPAGEPADISIGDDVQSVDNIVVQNGSSMQQAKVYVNVSSLSQNGVDLSSASTTNHQVNISGASASEANFNGDTFEITVTNLGGATSFELDFDVQFSSDSATQATGLTHAVDASAGSTTNSTKQSGDGLGFTSASYAIGNPDAGQDGTWDSGTTRWQGQGLYFDQGDLSGSHSNWQIRNWDRQAANDRLGSLVSDLSFENGRTVIDTDNLEGDYVITANNASGENREVIQTDNNGVAQDSAPASDGASDNQYVEIVPQNLDATFENSAGDEVNDVELDSSRTLVLDSNRNGYTVEISSENLTQTQLVNVFAGASASTDNDENVTISGLNSAAEVNAQFDETNDIEEGDSYDFNIEVTDTTAADTTSITVGEATDGDADWDEAQFSDQRGDIVAVTLTSEELDRFNVSVGGDNSNYQADIELEPNDDGEVELLINTYLASNNNFDVNNDDVFVASEGTILNQSQSGLNARSLDAGLYDLIIEDSNITTAEEDIQEYDVSVLSLEERSTNNMTVHTAPNNDFNSLTDTEDILELIEEERVTESDSIAINTERSSQSTSGDVIVHRVDVSGVEGILAQTGGSDFNGLNNSVATDNGEAFSVTLTQTNPGQNADPIQATLGEELTTSNSRVVADTANDTVYIIARSNALEGLGAETGDEFKAQFNVSSNYLNDFRRTSNQLDTSADANDQSASDNFELVDREATFDTVSDEVRVQPADNQIISGETTVAPGTQITVRARATAEDTDGDNAFLKSASTRVNADGTFEAEFTNGDSFEDVTPPQNFTASIQRQSFDDNAATDGRVVEGDYAEVSITNQTTDGTTATVDSVYLPDGGFVTIHDGTLLDGATFDSVRGTSDYLESGESTGVEVSLDTPYEADGTVIAMPHMDSNGNQEYDFVTSEGSDDAPYTNAEGEIVLDSASLTVDTSTPTPTATATATPEPTATATDEPTDEPTETASEDQPGFGAVIALIALLGAALLAARRNAF